MRSNDAPPDEELPIVTAFKWIKKHHNSDWDIRPQDTLPEKELPIVSTYKWTKEQINSEWNMSPSSWSSSRSPEGKSYKQTLTKPHTSHGNISTVKSSPPMTVKEKRPTTVPDPHVSGSSTNATDKNTSLRDTQLARLSSIATSKQAKRNSSKKNKLYIWAAVIVAVVWVFGKPVADAVTLSDADPQMKQLALDAGMNKAGELYFLRTHPVLTSGTGFTNDCGNHSNEVLEGCYLPNQGSIFIRTMPSQLSSEELVTAAHEMLHAAYHGLSESEKANVNSMVEAAYAQIHDSNLDNLVTQYAQSEPGARDDELHSILGTQYNNLPDNLEQYYSKYFLNRNDVITASQTTESTFTSYENDLTNLQNKISQENSQANADYSWHVYYANTGNEYYWNYYYNKYTSDIDQANNDIDSFNSELDNYKLLVSKYEGKDFSSITPAQQQSQSQ